MKHALDPVPEVREPRLHWPHVVDGETFAYDFARGGNTASDKTVSGSLASMAPEHLLCGSHSELNDTGCINQRALLIHRSSFVDLPYASPCDAGVMPPEQLS